VLNRFRLLQTQQQRLGMLRQRDERPLKRQFTQKQSVACSSGHRQNLPRRGHGPITKSDTQRLDQLKGWRQSADRFGVQNQHDLISGESRETEWRGVDRRWLLRHDLRKQFRGACRHRPSEMTVARVQEQIRKRGGSDDRHPICRHRPKTAPRPRICGIELLALQDIPQ
jgi:hypothetical protein